MGDLFGFLFSTNARLLPLNARQTKGAYSKYDMLVSTPMRIVALLRASAIDLSAVETVVLDEGAF